MGVPTQVVDDSALGRDSEPLSPGVRSLNRLTEVLVEMQEVSATGDVTGTGDLLQSLEYVGDLLDDIVESGATVPVVFRLPVELMDRLDAYVKRLNDADPSRRVTYNAVVRQLLTRALGAQGGPK
ncbi:MAG: hypothetical protein ACFCVA_15140 [Gammaproteobacteria bacterium]